MTGRRYLLTAALAVLLAAGTGLVILRIQGAFLPGENRTSRRLDAVIDLPDADSTRVASLARARCRLLSRGERRTCFQEVLLALVEKGRIRLAIGTLGRLGARDRGVRRQGHEYSHVIGINAWRPGMDLGAVYSQCSVLFQSGCYHGVIQAYFAWNGTDSATVAGICTSSPLIAQSAWLRFECVHGIGHALVQAEKLHLPRALLGCDQLREPFDQESCYGGAFMEFIVGARGQSHHPHVGPPDTLAREHDHGEQEAAPAFALRDPNDLLYPCTAVGERYRRQCYQMQPGIVFETAKGDVARMARACDGAPDRYKRSCYLGIGTYVSGLTGRDAKRTIRICSLGNPEYREWCFVGVVKNFIDVTGKSIDGIEYCRLLGDPRLASRCYVAVGEQVGFLLLFMKDRREACAKADPRYVGACLYGAGLTRERPPDLVGS